MIIMILTTLTHFPLFNISFFYTNVMQIPLSHFAPSNVWHRKFRCWLCCRLDYRELGRLNWRFQTRKSISIFALLSFRSLLKPVFIHKIYIHLSNSSGCKKSLYKPDQHVFIIYYRYKCNSNLMKIYFMYAL